LKRYKYNKKQKKDKLKEDDKKLPLVPDYKSKNDLKKEGTP